MWLDKGIEGEELGRDLSPSTNLVEADVMTHMGMEGDRWTGNMSI